MLNKKKIWSSTNAKSDKFLEETIVLNVMFLLKCKEVIVFVTGITSHGNDYLLVSTFSDIYLLIKHLVEDKVFK